MLISKITEDDACQTQLCDNSGSGSADLHLTRHMQSHLDLPYSSGLEVNGTLGRGREGAAHGAATHSNLSLAGGWALLIDRWLRPHI